MSNSNTLRWVEAGIILLIVSSIGMLSGNIPTASLIFTLGILGLAFLYLVHPFVRELPLKEPNKWDLVLWYVYPFVWHLCLIFGLVAYFGPDLLAVPIYYSGGVLFILSLVIGIPLLSKAESWSQVAFYTGILFRTFIFSLFLNYFYLT
ncbi:MAG: hypothetical protein ABEH38_05435 [Flavobacteriales bacterium]